MVDKLVNLMAIIILGSTVLLILMFMVGCNITMQNISTEGTASDLVDDTDSATSDFDLDATVPLK